MKPPGDAEAPRTPVPVAVGVLLREDGSFLLGSRPEGKPWAGYWEFPGGKIEPGETL
ncbi:MAG: NUDIX domain-containing protein, partial [Betaproteobacteria bacterium]|nr:NUDIX domain-containing protein [Betaproteobacteria bacterium]